MAVSKLFRYNGNFITLGERAFLERLIKKDVEFLMDKKIKLSMGNKFCPGPIKLKDNEITIYGKFIWLLKFGEYNNFLLNNLYQERDIFNNFAETYLSKK